MRRHFTLSFVAVLTLGGFAGALSAQSLDGGLEAELKLMRVQLAQIQLDAAADRKKAAELRKELDELKTFFKSDDHIQEFREWQSARAKLAEEKIALQQERAKLEQARVDLVRTARTESEKQELADQERREQRAEDRQRRSEEQQRIDELNAREVERARYLQRVYPYDFYNPYPQVSYPQVVVPRRLVDRRGPGAGHGDSGHGGRNSTGGSSGVSVGSGGFGVSVGGGIIPINRLPGGTVSPRPRANRTPSLMGGNPIYPWAGNR